MRWAGALLAACLISAWGATAAAETSADRFSAAGYFRVAARPDLDGGFSRLGLWNISGRLLNEGPYALLDLRLDVLPYNPGTNDPWTRLHARIEGGSVLGGDPQNGSLEAFRLTQLFAQAGNVLIPDVTFQVGSLYTSFGDLGLYDIRPAEIFFNTLGASATWNTDKVDLMVGVGDSGYPIRRDQYSTILTAGGTMKVRVIQGLEFGFGGEFFFEPAVTGNRFAPHTTPLPDSITYADFQRREIVQRYLEENPGREEDFPRPLPVDAISWKAVGYLGFGGFGPLRWNNFFINVQRRHPENFYFENASGQEFRIYTKELTDDRYEINGGNEMQLTLWPNRLDLAWGVLFGIHWDDDDAVVASERNRVYYSTVVRAQLYMTRTLHLLTETSVAREESTQGNLWRTHFDSVFTSTNGLNDQRGLEFGDSRYRDTWQLKGGFVLNPTGPGIFTRPSLRLLYGLQNSNVHNAFGNSFTETLDQFDEFRETRDRHWHQVISLEAEAWF